MWRWRRRTDDDFREEIQANIALDSERFASEGLSPEEANAAALRAFGNVTRAQERFYDSRRVTWLDNLQRDVRHGFRALSRRPGFTVVAVLTLALGVGANTAIFSVIRAVLLKPLPYADANRLVLLGETRPGTPAYGDAISAPNYLDWTQQNTVFDQMAAVTGGDVTVGRGTAEPVFAAGRTVSASYFDVFGLRAALGRTFAPDEDRPDRSHVVVLSHRLWNSQFGSDPSVIGKPIRLDGESYTVIGVMPAGAGVDILDPELWKPRDLGHEGGALTHDGHTERGRHDLNRAVAKLKSGVTLEQARTQMNTIAARLARAYPDSNTGWGVLVQPWPRPIFQDFERSLYLLVIAVGMVLLIGCVNIANLTLARRSARAHDVAIRAALGAGRGRLVRQLLTENLIIAICGCACGVFVGYAMLAGIRTAIPSTGMFKVVPSETTIAMDAPIWLFSLALSTLSGLAFGLGPAVSATRPALTGSIKEGERPRVSTGLPPRRFRQSLVVIEVALAFVLLTVASVLIQSFFDLQQRISAGFQSTNILTARLPVQSGRFKTPEALNAYFDQIADRIQSLPGIRDVAFTEGLPTQGTPFGRTFQVADQPPVEHSRRSISGFKVVSASYFHTLGLRILEGRPLLDDDRQGAPFVVVINETFARMYFASVNPIGRRLLMGGTSTGRSSVSKDVAWEVVGVVADEGLSWDGAQQALAYGTREQSPSDYLALVVRGALDPTRFQESVRKAVSAFNRDQALANIEPLDQLKVDVMASDRVRSTLLGAFAVVAVALAALGLYGVLAFAVVQRTREIGIRAALGASTGSLVTLVIREGMLMISGGLVLGLIGVFITSRLLTALLFGIRPTNPTTLLAVAGLLAAVALIACYIPARRATRVDPMVALRCE